jgi:hypothetical protein
MKTSFALLSSVFAFALSAFAACGGSGTSDSPPPPDTNRSRSDQNPGDPMRSHPSSPDAGPPRMQSHDAGQQPMSDVGKTCQMNSECSTRLCVFAGSASYGYCTKECESFANCPTFWDCGRVQNGSTTYCLKH